MHYIVQFIVRITFFCVRNCTLVHLERFLIYHATIMRVAASGISAPTDYIEEFQYRSSNGRAPARYIG